MSGFITIYNIDGEPVDRSLIYSMTQTLKFRGPDQQQVWVDGNIGMGHALFKTTFEAEYENQPATVDNKVWITCSARIDDRENLVNKMGLKQSLDLSRTPDSDLILHAYRKWGEECLDHLLGDFAFVIWDNIKQKLFCVRDRFGTKQLYYVHKNNSIIISNTLNCIKQHPSVSKQLNDKAIGGFLLFGDHMWIDKTITVLNDVKTLPPAYSLVLQNGKISFKKYWDISPDLSIIRYKRESDYIEHFNDIFKVAVKDRIRTNSLAIAMSGGMDSTTVAATVRQLEKENTIPPLKVQAVTAVYDRVLPCQERYYAGIVARHLNIPIHYLSGDNYPFMKPFVLTTRPLEIDTFSFWKDIRKTFSSYSRVVLTGDSADNLLEYSPVINTLKEVNILKVISNIYRLKKLYKKTPALGTGLVSRFKALLSSNKNGIISPYPFPDWLNSEFSEKMDLKKIWEDVLNELNGKSDTVFPRHPNAYKALINVDWNTDDIIMASEFTLTEERDPFLDIRLIEFLFSIPALPWFFKKHILRQAMDKILPKEIIDRPKTPVGNLQENFMLEPSSEWLKNWEANDDIYNYIDPNKVPKFHSLSLSNDERYLALRTITLNSWLEAFKKSY